VTRWLGSHPRRPVTTEEEARRRLTAWREHGQGLAAPLGLWAVVPNGAPGPVGTVLLLPLSDDTGLTGLIEIGWHLHPDYQGQGLATEAALALLGVAGQAGTDEVLAITDLDNTASQRVAGRLGMTDDGVTQRWFGLTARQYRVAV
jgi:RimJ/RimL family protein N-acetyltransferase